MNLEKTLLMIKPDITKNHKIGEIISIIEKNNLTIDNIKTVTFTKMQAEFFYNEHKNKTFFSELVSFITSNKIVTIILSGENIINKTRTLIGHTNYKLAEKNTIRALYATTLTANAVHASDSYESAIKEIKFISELK